MDMRRLTAIALASFVAPGCSLIIGGDKDACDGGRCTDQNTCADGFSCRVSECIADGCLTAGHTCTFDAQCADGLLCGTSPFYCMPACSAFFEGAGCDSGEYCRPERLPASTTWRGTCFASECNANTDCEPDRACVAITSSAKACLFPCEPRVGVSGMYTDNCGSSPQFPKYCQPIGIDQVPVCLDELAPAATLDDPCSPVSDGQANACAMGLSCIPDLSVCSPYCNSGSDDCSAAPATATQCCDHTTPAAFTWSVCQSACP